MLVQDRRGQPSSQFARDESTLIEPTLPLALGAQRYGDERIDLERALSAPAETVDISELESAFADVAASYSGRKGITYSAWREVGVPAVVLKRAGISRGGT